MVENDIHISLKETIALSKKVVFINYNPKDEPYTTPLKDLIHRVNMDYATTANLGSTKDNAFDLIINIVTENFLNDETCINSFSLHSQKPSGISIIFADFGAVQEKLYGILGDEMHSSLGEIIIFSELGESLENYLLNALYSKEPFYGKYGILHDELLDKVEAALQELAKPTRFVIGDEDTVILALGSMGYSTIKMWYSQGFDVKSKVVLAVKNEAVFKGQPDFDENVAKWVVNAEQGYGNDYISDLKFRIAYWLKNNVNEKRLIIIGGLGKTTTSILMPLIITQAKQIGIDTHIICTIPFSFESKNIKDIADRSLGIIRTISNSNIYLDLGEFGNLKGNDTIPMDEFMTLIGYVLAVAANAFCQELSPKTGTCRIWVPSWEDFIKQHESFQDSYENLDVSILPEN